MSMDSEYERRERSESLSAPRRPRMSFSEVPEELLSLDLNDIALPPMNAKAEIKKSHHYSLRDLIRNTDALPPVNLLRPKEQEGKIVVDPMRDRPRYQPVAEGTPTRFQALLSLRDSAGAQGHFTADFFKRTGFEIPSELDPDIPSRRESNLSASDWDPDEELETKMSRLPPLPESFSEHDLQSAFAAKGLRTDGEDGGGASAKDEKEKGKVQDSPRNVPKSDNFGTLTPHEEEHAPSGDTQGVFPRTPSGGFDIDLSVSTTDKLLASLVVLGLSGCSLWAVLRWFRKRD